MSTKRGHASSSLDDLLSQPIFQLGKEVVPKPVQAKAPKPVQAKAPKHQPRKDDAKPGQQPGKRKQPDADEADDKPVTKKPKPSPSPSHHKQQQQRQQPKAQQQQPKQPKAQQQQPKQPKAQQQQQQQQPKHQEQAPKPNAVATPKPTAPVSTMPQQQKAKAASFVELQKKRLQGSRFRWINEQLYTTTGKDAFEKFSDEPELFDAYHQGFAEQVAQWPSNPVDEIMAELRKLPKGKIVADMGCGEAKIAQGLGKHHTVHSFDLVAANEHIVACDISKVPLPSQSVDVVVFCLSLMGTNYIDFVREGVRLLRSGGTMMISEVVSRLVDMDAFVSSLRSLGLQLQTKDTSNKMFVSMTFHKKQGGSGEQSQKKKNNAKEGSSSSSSSSSDSAALKPCIYKKR